jgi:hypothetical protein
LINISRKNTLFKEHEDKAKERRNSQKSATKEEEKIEVEKGEK